MQNTVDALAAQHTLDEAVISYVATEAEANREKIAHLEVALTTNRRIGAAIGIIMVRLHVTYDQGFDILRAASQHRHRKLRDIAEDVLLTGDLP